MIKGVLVLVPYVLIMGIELVRVLKARRLLIGRLSVVRREQHRCVGRRWPRESHLGTGERIRDQRIRAT